MSIIDELLKDVPVPKMMKVRQSFDDTKIEDVDAALNEALQQEAVRATVKPGMEIAVAVGSRGVDQIVQITKRTVTFLKEMGAKPFIVPSMKSRWCFSRRASSCSCTFRCNGRNCWCRNSFIYGSD